LVVEAKQVVLDRSDIQLCKLQDKWSRDALVEIVFCNANYDQNGAKFLFGQKNDRKNFSA